MSRNFRDRLIWGIPMFLFGISAAVIGGWLLLLVMIAIAGLGALEIRQMTRVNSASPCQQTGSCSALTASYVIIWKRKYQQISLVTVLSLILYLLGALAILRLRAVFPPIYLVFVVFIAVTNDVGAYFFGRFASRYGKITPLPAWINDRKCVEGLIGGWVSSLLVARIIWCVSLASTWSWTETVVLAIAAIIGSSAGDLLGSVTKRIAEIKDFNTSWTLIPGHGGVFDRFFSVLLATLTFSLIQIFLL